MPDSKFTLNIQFFLSGFNKEDYDYLTEDSKELTSVKDEIEGSLINSKIIRSENDYPVYKLMMPSDDEIKNEGQVLFIFHAWIPLSNNSDDVANEIKEFICKLSEIQETLVRGFIPRRNEPFLHIFLENCLDKIDCLEITNEDIEDMD